MRLKEWKAGHPGMTADVMAARCGVKRIAIQRILAGRTMPRPATAEAIRAMTGGAVTSSDLAAAYNERRPAV